ncbi:hypothetical protein ACOSP7_023025 [Xanthoceras sorbifolium]
MKRRRMEGGWERKEEEDCVGPIKETVLFGNGNSGAQNPARDKRLEGVRRRNLMRTRRVRNQREDPIIAPHAARHS